MTSKQECVTFYMVLQMLDLYKKKMMEQNNEIDLGKSCFLC